MKKANKKLPLVSIVIATRNSGLVLSRVLNSIKKQDYPKNKIEILIIDGESGDNTKAIAKKYSCRLIINPKIDQVYAKYVGYREAKGKYIMFIDSDEVMENKKSIINKVDTMISRSNVKVVLSSGYKTSNEFPDINSYLSEFGDPFTYFMYHDSKDPKFFLINLRNNYKIIAEDNKKAIFDFSDGMTPFIELTSMCVLIDLDYVRKNIPIIFKKPSVHTHLFYLMVQRRNFFAVMKNDPIIHYSASNISAYIRKIRSRIKSNVYRNDMGKAGFSGREQYQSFWFNLKKFVYILYVCSIVFPLIDAIYLSISRGKLVYLLHFFLNFIVAIMIVYYFFLKVLGRKLNLVGYGT